VSDYKLTPEEQKRVAEIVAKMHSLGDVIKKVMPDLDDEECGTLAHNLADVWGIARNHCERVETILKLQGPDDSKILGGLLEDLFYGDMEGELPYHLESMRETLPAIIERLLPNE
jgi:hypothetical protein